MKTTPETQRTTLRLSPANKTVFSADLRLTNVGFRPKAVIRPGELFPESATADPCLASHITPRQIRADSRRHRRPMAGPTDQTQ